MLVHLSPWKSVKGVTTSLTLSSLSNTSTTPTPNGKNHVKQKKKSQKQRKSSKSSLHPQHSSISTTDIDISIIARPPPTTSSSNDNYYDRHRRKRRVTFDSSSSSSSPSSDDDDSDDDDDTSQQTPSQPLIALRTPHSISLIDPSHGDSDDTTTAPPSYSLETKTQKPPTNGHHHHYPSSPPIPPVLDAAGHLYALNRHNDTLLSWNVPSSTTTWRQSSGKPQCRQSLPSPAVSLHALFDRGIIGGCLADGRCFIALSRGEGQNRRLVLTVSTTADEDDDEADQEPLFSTLTALTPRSKSGTKRRLSSSSAPLHAVIVAIVRRRSSTDELILRRTTATIPPLSSTDEVIILPGDRRTISLSPTNNTTSNNSRGTVDADSVRLCFLSRETMFIAYRRHNRPNDDDEDATRDENPENYQHWGMIVSPTDGRRLRPLIDLDGLLPSPPTAVGGLSPSIVALWGMDSKIRLVDVSVGMIVGCHDVTMLGDAVTLVSDGGSGTVLLWGEMTTEEGGVKAVVSRLVTEEEGEEEVVGGEGYGLSMALGSFMATSAVESRRDVSEETMTSVDRNVSSLFQNESTTTTKTPPPNDEDSENTRLWTSFISHLRSNPHTIPPLPSSTPLRNGLSTTTLPPLPPSLLPPLLSTLLFTLPSTATHANLPPLLHHAVSSSPHHLSRRDVDLIFETVVPRLPPSSPLFELMGRRFDLSERHCVMMLKALFCSRISVAVSSTESYGVARGIVSSSQVNETLLRAALVEIWGESVSERKVLLLLLAILLDETAKRRHRRGMDGALKWLSAALDVVIDQSDATTNEAYEGVLARVRRSVAVVVDSTNDILSLKDLTNYIMVTTEGRQRREKEEEEDVVVNWELVKRDEKKVVETGYTIERLLF